MRKKLITIVFTMILSIAMVLSSCVPQSDVSVSENSSLIDSASKIIVAEEAVFYDYINESSFGFNIIVFSMERITETEIVEIFGENTDKISINIKNDTFETLKSDLYRGYYTTILGFTGTSDCENFTIECLNVKLNDRNVNIDLKYPIKHCKMINEFNDEYKYVCDGGRPLMITSTAISGGEGSYQYGFDAFADITVTSLRIANVIDIDEAAIAVDGKTLGNFDAIAPYLIKKGEHFIITMMFSYADNIPQQVGLGVTASIILDYTLNDGSEHSLHIPFIVQSISNVAEAHTLLDYYLDSKSKG